MTDARLARHYFEVRESGDERLPWMLWDVDEEVPYSYHADGLDVEAALVRLGWSINRMMAGQDPRWP